jgi:hypothetical protein
MNPTQCVWDCDNNDGSKYFLLRNALKYIFFIFKKLFLILSHQNNFKKYIYIYIYKLFQVKK